MIPNTQDALPILHMPLLTLCQQPGLPNTPHNNLFTNSRILGKSLNAPQTSSCSIAIGGQSVSRSDEFGGDLMY
jgi:hypothetical protein